MNQETKDVLRKLLGIKPYGRFGRGNPNITYRTIRSVWKVGVNRFHKTSWGGPINLGQRPIV